MKTIKILIALTTLSLFSMAATAESVIAVIDQDYVLFNSQVAQLETQKLRTEFQGQEAQVLQLKKDIDALTSRMNSSLLADEEKAGLQIEQRNMIADYDQKVQYLNLVQNDRRQKFIEMYKADFSEVVQLLIEEKNIDLLVDINAVVFAKDSKNITLEALERFNKKTALKAE